MTEADGECVGVDQGQARIFESSSATHVMLRAGSRTCTIEYGSFVRQHADDVKTRPESGMWRQHCQQRASEGGVVVFEWTGRLRGGMDALADDEDVGIRLVELGSFCADHRVAERQLTTEQVRDEIINPETVGRRCSYAALHPGKVGHGPIILFLSHAWSGRLIDLYKCAKCWARKHSIPETDLCLWIDIFTVNQHVEVQDAAENFQVFSSKFEAKLKKFGRALIVLSPLDNPAWLFRVWCLFEFLIMHLLGLEVEFMVPPESTNAFVRQLCTESVRILDLLCRVDMEKAKAFSLYDEANIKSLVRQRVGFQTLNRLACDAVRVFCVTVGEEALEKDMPVEGSESPDELRRVLLFNLGGVHFDLGHYDSALSFIGQSVVICERIHGPIHQKYGRIKNNMGIVFQKLGENQMALRMFEEALAIFLGAVGPSHQSVGSTKNNMAHVYERLGDFFKALTMFKEALAVFISAVGPNHQSVGVTKNNKAIVYERLGEYEKALSMHKEALAIKIAAVGPNHLSVGNTKNNMAIVYERLGEHEKALEMYKEALAIKIAAVGPKHQSVGVTKNNMAIVYERLGEHEKAISMYKEALAIAGVCPKHSSVADTKYNMADLLKSQGRMTEAKALYQECAEIYQAAYGAEHKDTLDSLAQARSC